MINVTKNGETKIYKAVQELNTMIEQNDGNQRNSDRTKISKQLKFVNREHFRAGATNGRKPLIITQVKQKKKVSDKKIKPYNTTRITPQNFLTSISYNRVKEEDLFDRSFVFNICI